MPALYLLAVEGCRLLGLDTVPQLYIKSSSEAAAFYLLLPSDSRLHGMNGAAAPPLPQHQKQPGPAGAGAGACPPRPHEGGWQCAVVLTSALVDLLDAAELLAVLAGVLGVHAALLAPPGGGGSGPDDQLRVLCRSLAALATLGTLGVLCPESLARQLPQQMAPYLHSRVLPVLARALRYMPLYCDRVAAAATGSLLPVAAAAAKTAAGCAVLRNELNVEALLAQAACLERASAELAHVQQQRAPALEEAVTADAATGAPMASLVLLRVRELQRWWGEQQAVALHST